MDKTEREKKAKEFMALAAGPCEKHFWAVSAAFWRYRQSEGTWRQTQALLNAQSVAGMYAKKYLNEEAK